MVFKLQIKAFVIWTTLWFCVRGSGTDSDGEKLEVLMTVTADTDLICSDEGLLPSAVESAKHGSNKSLHNDTMEVQNKTKTAILNMTAEHFGRYICTAQHQNSTLTEVNITVIHVKKPDISFNTTTTAVKPAGALSLTCMAGSLNSSVTTWIKVTCVLQNDSRSVTVTIQDVRANYSGPYTGTPKPMSNTGDNDEVNTTVNSISEPEITGRTSVKEGDRLDLMCSAEGLPFLITWTKVGSTKNLSSRIYTRVKNSAMLFISNVTAEDSGRYMCRVEHRNTTVTVDVNVTVILKVEEEEEKEEEEKEDLNMKILRRIIQLEIILAVLVGILLAVCICCLARKCCRKKQKRSGYQAETLEMVTSQQDQLVESAEEHDHTHHHPEGETEDTAKSDVEYSNINISVLPRNGAMAAEHVQNTTNSEYSEIKKHKRGQERYEGEEEEMIGEKETHRGPTEEDDEDAELYSSVKDVMDQM